jgi:hypothetical protein
MSKTVENNSELIIISTMDTNDGFTEPPVPDKLRPKTITNNDSKKLQSNNRKRSKNDLVNLSDSDNDLSDISSVSGSQSNQMRITNKSLQDKITNLELNSKSQSAKINDLNKIIETLVKKITNLEEKVNVIDSNSVEMKDANNIQLNSNKPLFSDLFKSKETENMSFEVKNIYNIQQDLLERDNKKNNIIIYGLPIDKFENNDIDFDSDNLKIDKMLTKVSVDLSKIVKFKRLINKSGIITNPPILIEFKEYNEKINLLKKSSEIRKFSEYEKIYINEDLTTAQRIINKDLIQLRNNLNTQHNTKDVNVNYYYTIRNFKVVKKLKSL